MKHDRARQIVEAFSGQRVLVVGEVILDAFIWGKVSRISPEAPVPVVEVESESFYAGGAANVVRNLHELGCRCELASLIGADAGAAQLKALLGPYGVDFANLEEDPAYQTIVKTRIIAKNQQVVRVDREQRKSGFSPELRARVLERIDAMLPGLDAIIMEDYGKGIITQQIADEIGARAAAAGVPVTVDPNAANPIRWRGVTAVTPNRSEAFAAAGAPWSDPVEPAMDDQELMSVGAALLEKWDAQNLLVTLSEQGMMLFRRDDQPFHIPTRAQEVFDVSGAGDTAIAAFTLALCAGATAIEAAEISNHASGIVVGKLGTATVTREELLRSFEGEA